MRIIHKIQHGGEREIDVGGGGGGDMFICGGYEFPVTTEKGKSITDLLSAQLRTTTRQHYSYNKTVRGHKT